MSHKNYQHRQVDTNENIDGPLNKSTEHTSTQIHMTLCVRVSNFRAIQLQFSILHPNKHKNIGIKSIYPVLSLPANDGFI